MKLKRWLTTLCALGCFFTVQTAFAQDWETVFTFDFEDTALNEKPTELSGGEGDDTDGIGIDWFVTDYVGYDNEPDGTARNLAILDNSDQGNAVIAVPFPAQTGNFRLTLYAANNKLGSSFIRFALGSTQEEGLDGGGRGGIGYLDLNMNTTNGTNPKFNSEVTGPTLPHSNAAMHKVQFYAYWDEEAGGYTQITGEVDGQMVTSPIPALNARGQLDLLYIITSTGGTNIDLSVDDISVAVGGPDFVMKDRVFTPTETVYSEDFEDIALGEIPAEWGFGDGDDSDGATVYWEVSDQVGFDGEPAGTTKNMMLLDEFDGGNIIAEVYFPAQTQDLRLSFYVSTTELSTGDEGDDTVRVAMGDIDDGGIASSGMDGIGYADVSFMPIAGALKLDFNNTEHPQELTIPHEDNQMHFCEYVVFRNEEDTAYEQRKFFVDGIEAYMLTLTEFQRTKLDLLRFITYTGGFHHIFIDDVKIEIGTSEEVTGVEDWSLY